MRGETNAAPSGGGEKSYKITSTSAAASFGYPASAKAGELVKSKKTFQSVALDGPIIRAASGQMWDAWLDSQNQGTMKPAVFIMPAEDVTVQTVLG